MIYLENFLIEDFDIEKEKWQFISSGYRKKNMARGSMNVWKL